MRPGFFLALTYPFRGLGHLGTTPGLWKYAVGAFISNALVFAGFLVAMWFLYDDLAALITPESWPAWLKTVSGCLVGLAISIPALFLVTIVGNIVAGPFLEAMSARMLRDLGETRPPDRSLAAAFGWSILNQAVKLVVFGTIQVGLLVLWLTPVGFLHPFIAGALTALFLGFEYCEYPLEVRQMSAVSRFGWMFRQFGPTLAYGTVLFGVMYVPCLGYLLLPASVCGATRLVHDLDAGVRQASTASR